MKYSPYIFFTILISGSLLVGCGGSTEEEATATPEDNTTITTSSLVINEIVADAADGSHDWIELYAREGSVSLASYSLVDDNSDRVAQSLPNVTLAEGEFIVIQAISDTDTPPEEGYFVTFKLGGDDAVMLLKDNVQVDILDWDEGDAPAGFSYGLFTDGVNNPQTLMPTPGETNVEITDTAPETLDTIVNENALLRINEIVAKDSADGDDWIELYVTGDSSVNLSDYSLADDNNELVSLPNITLSPGDYYRIIASTEQISNEDFVSFKLGSSDQVNLYKGDDLVDQLSWNKGQALIGFSYGRFPEGSDSTKTLLPTPENTNQLAQHGPLVINEVVANDINGGDDWFELYNNSNENIALGDYQVIDESNDIEPANLPNLTLVPGEFVVIFANGVQNNALTGSYSVSFKLGKSDELSLLLNDETVDYIDWDESDVPAGFSYGLSAVESDLTSWDKDFLLPTQGTANQITTAFTPSVVHDLSINITTENWTDILNNPLDEAYHEASITFNGVTLDSVAIRTKGGSSLNSVANSASDRYSFKIDINEYVSGQKFFGLKKFTLQNSFNDPSYMREVIAYDLLDEMGVATPEHAYVNFYVNGELFGFYLMVEAIDGEFLENHFANANGDLYKPDGTGSDLMWINNDITSYSDINLQTNEDTTDNGAFINFVEAMANGSTDVINVDSLLRYMSVSVALSNLDSYHGSLAHNYYLYEDDGVFNLLPWDFNEAFGSFSMGCNGVDVRDLYIDEPIIGPISDRPMVATVFSNEDNLALYHEYLWQLIEGPLSSDAFNTRITDIANLIDEHVENDPSGFYSYAEFVMNLNDSVDRFFGLTEFMDYRVTNMTKQLQGDLPTQGDGSGFCDGANTGPQRP